MFLCLRVTGPVAEIWNHHSQDVDTFLSVLTPSPHNVKQEVVKAIACDLQYFTTTFERSLKVSFCQIHRSCYTTRNNLDHDPTKARKYSFWTKSKYRTRDFSMMSFMWSRTQIDYSKTSKHNLLISFLSRCVAAHHFFHCLDSCTWTQHMMLIDDLLFSLLFVLLSLSLHSEQNFWLVWILLHDLANLQPGCPMLVVICFHIHVIPLIISLFFERLRGITASGRHCCVNKLVCRLDLTRL